MKSINRVCNVLINLLLLRANVRVLMCLQCNEHDSKEFVAIRFYVYNTYCQHAQCIERAHTSLTKL